MGVCVTVHNSYSIVTIDKSLSAQYFLLFSSHAPASNTLKTNLTGTNCEVHVYILHFLRIFSSDKKKTDGNGGSPLERSRQEDLPKIYSRNMTRYIYSVVYFESDHKCPYTRSTHKKPSSHTGTYTKRKKSQRYRKYTDEN